VYDVFKNQYNTLALAGLVSASIAFTRAPMPATWGSLYAMGYRGLVIWQVISLMVFVIFIVASFLHESIVNKKSAITQLWELLAFIGFLSTITVLTRPNVPRCLIEVFSSGSIWIFFWRIGSLLLFITASLVVILRKTPEQIKDLTGESFDELLEKPDFFLLVFFLICIFITGFSLTQRVLPLESIELETFADFRGFIWNSDRYGIVFGVGLTWAFCFFVFSEIVKRIKSKNLLNTLTLGKLYKKHLLTERIGTSILLLMTITIILQIFLMLRIDPLTIWIGLVLLYFQDYIIRYLLELADKHKQSIKIIQEAERDRDYVIHGLSHDIRTPLMAIANRAELLQDLELDKNNAEDLEVILRNTERVAALYKELKETSEASSPIFRLNIEEVCISDIVNQVLTDFERNFKDRDLIVVPPNTEEPMYASTDQQNLRRILDNIIGNAARYSLPGTRVFVDISDHDWRPIITVRNTSTGLSSIRKEDYVKPLFRGDGARNTPGSGLGLYNAKSLMEKMGHFDITVDGDTFLVTLKFDIANPSILSIEEPPHNVPSLFLDPLSESPGDINWGESSVVYSDPVSDFAIFKRWLHESTLMNVTNVRFLSSSKKRQKPKRSIVSLNQAIEDVANNVRHHFTARNINLLIQIPEKNISVRTVYDDFYHILENLLINTAQRAIPHTHVFAMLVEKSDGVDAFYHEGPGVVIKGVSQIPIDPDDNNLTTELLAITDDKTTMSQLVKSTKGLLRIFASGDAFMIKLVFFRPIPIKKDS